jgi:hypothetical protein
VFSRARVPAEQIHQQEDQRVTPVEWVPWFKRTEGLNDETARLNFARYYYSKEGCLMVFMMRLIAAAVVVLLPCIAIALDCPKQPEQTNKEWDVQVKTAVGKIGPVKGAELESKTKSVVQDLMGKLPQADKIYLTQMMYSSYCSGLRDDKTLSEEEKAARIRTYNLELQRSILSSPVKKN